MLVLGTSIRSAIDRTLSRDGTVFLSSRNGTRSRLAKAANIARWAFVRLGKLGQHRCS
jgi:hypothetical protein